MDLKDTIIKQLSAPVKRKGTQGYNAFFTRGVSGWQPTLDRHLEMARRISECDHPNLVVYGGGKDIADWCMAKQVVHIGEYMNRGRERAMPNDTNLASKC